METGISGKQIHVLLSEKYMCLVSNQLKPSNQLTKLYDFHYQSGEGRENIKEKFKGKYMVYKNDKQ